MTSHSQVVVQHMLNERGVCRSCKKVQCFEYLGQIIGYIKKHKISTKTDRFVFISSVSLVLKTA